MHISKDLEQMGVPDPSIGPNAPLKIALTSAKKSAAIGVWLVAVPIFFLCAIVMKYFFHVNLHLIDVFEEMMAHLDKDSSTKWITPVFFVLLPLAGIVLNVLAIAHVEYRRTLRQFIITVKLKYVNMLICLVSLAVVGIVLLHAIMDR